jgi:hypothetical protein
MRLSYTISQLDRLPDLIFLYQVDCSISSVQFNSFRLFRSLLLHIVRTIGATRAAAGLAADHVLEVGDDV